MSLNHMIGFVLLLAGGYIFYTGLQIQQGVSKWSTLCQTVTYEETSFKEDYQGKTSKYNMRIGGLFLGVGVLCMFLNHVLFFAITLLLFFGGLNILKAKTEISLKE